MYRLTLGGVVLFLATVSTAFADPPKGDAPKDALQLTAFVPSTVFQLGEHPVYAVVEVKNNLSRTVRLSDRPATRTYVEAETVPRTDDESKLPADEVVKLFFSCEFVYPKSTPARAYSRVPLEEGKVYAIEPGETRLIKLKLDMLVPPGKCRWRVAVRLGGERTSPALGISQTLDVNVADTPR